MLFLQHLFITSENLKKLPIVTRGTLGDLVQSFFFETTGGTGDLVVLGYGESIVAYWTVAVDATMRTAPRELGCEKSVGMS